MNRKWYLESVSEVFKSEGCELISLEYINTSLPLEYIAKCGHKYNISLENFLAGKGRVCKKCRYKAISEKKRQKYEDIKQIFALNGCQLKSKSYKGNREKLEYIAQCGHFNSIELSKFKSGSGRVCAKCSKSIRYEYNYVFESFLNEGCLLKETEYINCKQPLRFTAKCGHESITTFDNFLNSSKSKYCRDCQKINHYNIQKVKELFSKQGCTVIDGEYIAKKKIYYVASCGHNHKILLSKFLSGQGIVCAKCARPKGEKHFAYNPNLTEEDRIINRDYYDYIKWRIKIYERDHYTCQHCNDNTGGNLVAHHIDAYRSFQDKQLDINNGITLCRKCHSDFHLKYGYGHNTREQFEQWQGNTEVKQGFKAPAHRNA